MADAALSPSESSGRAGIPEWLTGRLGLVAGALGIMWVVEILSVGIDSIDNNGILPRMLDGLDGILWSPFLHSGFPHLISNTIPFAILRGLVLVRGAKRWLSASAIIIGLGGLLVWAFAIGSNENHIGASGWVFGLFGFLVLSAFFERKPVSIGLGLITLFLYGGTILFGVIPRDGISWEGHLFGFIAGVVAARVLSRRAAKSIETGTDGILGS